MKKLVAVLWIFPLLALAGCGDDTVGPSSIHGTYTLQTIDSAPLPAPYQTYTATGGSTTLNSDGTWSTVLDLQGQDGLSNNGEYAYQDGVVTFFDQTNASFGGIISGDTLTVAGGTNQLMYVK